MMKSDWLDKELILRNMTRISTCLLLIRYNEHHAMIVRSVIKKMDAVTILPPESVRGMKQLEKEQFRMTVSVPAIRLRPQMVSEYLKKLKSVLLRQPGVKRIQDCSQVRKRQCIRSALKMRAWYL